MMEMIILLLAAIFFFAVATLFRSNEALDRVGEVEKEIKNVEKEIGVRQAEPLYSADCAGARFAGVSKSPKYPHGISPSRPS
jgi:hypothetical protein